MSICSETAPAVNTDPPPPPVPAPRPKPCKRRRNPGPATWASINARISTERHYVAELHPDSPAHQADARERRLTRSRSRARHQGDRLISAAGTAVTAALTVGAPAIDMMEAA